VLARTVSAAKKKPKPAPASAVPAFLGDNSAISSNGFTIAFGEPKAGATVVFTKASGASTWTQTAQLNGGGDSVAVSSNGAIVAAGQTGINNFNGALFVFKESGGTFTETSAGTWALTATDAEPNPVSDDDLGGGDQPASLA
jgi:hypothetical protein